MICTFKKRLFTVLILAGSLSLGLSTSQADIVLVGNSLGEVGTAPADAIPFANIFASDLDSGPGLISNGVSAPNAGVTFDLQIATSTTVALAPRGPNAANAGFLGLDDPTGVTGGPGTFFANDDLLTITVSNVSAIAPGFTAVFDGFTNFGSADTPNNNGSGFTIDGNQTFLRSGGNNGPNDPRQGVELTGGLVAGPSTTFLVENQAALRGFNLSFTVTEAAVPEPSSLLLVGFAGVGLLSRRRR